MSDITLPPDIAAVARSLANYVMETEAEDFERAVVEDELAPVDGVDRDEWHRRRQVCEDEGCVPTEEWVWLAENTAGHIYTDAWCANAFLRKHNR